MHAQRPMPSRSLWADLDALVLEEVDALDAPPRDGIEPPAFASEDDFLAQAVGYLRLRDDPLRLIAALSAELGLSHGHETELSDESFEDAEMPPDLPPPAPEVSVAQPEPGPAS